MKIKVKKLTKKEQKQKQEQEQLIAQELVREKRRLQDERYQRNKELKELQYVRKQLIKLHCKVTTKVAKTAVDLYMHKFCYINASINQRLTFITKTLESK